MAELFVYRTYDLSTKGQDPILEEVEKVVSKDKMDKKLGMLSALTGVSRTTFDNWFKRKTRCPRYSTVAATFAALGYYPEFKRTGRFDLDSEMIDAKRWQVRRKAAKLAALERKKGRKNGNGAHAS